MSAQLPQAARRVGAAAHKAMLGAPSAEPTAPIAGADLATPAASVGSVTPAPSTSPASPASRRRPLWELPTQAHEILLATAFTPEVLRREVARTLGQMHKARCKLAGRDVDVLYGAVHDLAARNPLSEALQRRLDERYPLALRRWLPLRGHEALVSAWHAVREAETLPGELWALLRHPQSAGLEAEALYDARAWVFRHARADVARCAARQDLQQRLQLAEQALHEARTRAAQQQRHTDAALRHLRQELAAVVGEAARWRASAEALAQALAAAPAQPGMQVLAAGQPPECAAPPADAAASGTAACAQRAVLRRLLPLPPRAASPAAPYTGLQATSQAAWPAIPTPAADPARAAAAALAPRDAEPMQGRQVLCVGGIRHAVSRYRCRVERLGARFEHHDGGIEDGLRGLDGCLQRADLVICQAACINHEAYHRIKRHCERTGKPCLYLERPSLAHLDRALSPWATHPNKARSAA